MKKLLTILGSVGLVVTTSAAVIACGDKTSQKTPDTKPTEETRKEDKEEPKKDDEKTENKEKMDFSKIDKNLGNLEPDNRNILSQDRIKEEIAKRLTVTKPDLQDFQVDHEKGTVKVTLPRFENKTIEFTFTSYLDLRKSFETNKNGKSFLDISKIKKEIAKRMNVKPEELQELSVDYNNNKGTVHSTKFTGTLTFKFNTEKK
ncbi:lipoprotein [Mycoplasma leachii]|uniref:Putative lipoprotein n=1 Tax=Mycoplasma leachii 06049 TaxID=1188244 RepID=A0A2T4I9P1_9MOLU|nr:lipoprotein [Mycoplasma leachii]PTD31266.1 putative lipoprotein [Mycoplasma leachii 06049]